MSNKAPVTFSDNVSESERQEITKAALTAIFVHINPQISKINFRDKNVDFTFSTFHVTKHAPDYDSWGLWRQGDTTDNLTGRMSKAELIEEIKRRVETEGMGT